MGPGDRVGRYVIVSLLGQGGMGEVYRAYDEVLRRDVALKLLREGGPEPAGPGAHAAAGRVLREARMAAALTHPNVVAIHDVGEHEGTPFIVMELVHGRPLRALVGAGAPVAERLRWLVDVARALGAAHRRGLVHRDVKPENVLLSDEGAIKVLDFGIAHLSQEAPHESAPAARAAGSEPPPRDRSLLAGTPGYMAPELLRGAGVDARADQFAWGVMAHELLSGGSPWEGAEGSIVQAILGHAAPPLDAAALGIGAHVAEAVARAMRKDPGQRFASMDALVSTLGVSPLGDSGRNVSLRPPEPDLAGAPTVPALSLASMDGPTTAPAQRRRWSARLVLPVAAAAVAVAGFASVAALRAGARRPEPARAGPEPAPSAAPLPAFRPTGARRLTFDPGCEEFPSFAPDGRSVVYDATFGDDSHLVELDLASGAQKVLTSDHGWQFAASVSPDGREVAYVAEGDGRVGTYVLTRGADEPPRLLRAGNLRPSWSLDGRAVWAGPGQAPERVDRASDQTTRTIAAPAGRTLTEVLELPDGQVLARGISRDSQDAAGLLRYRPGAPAPDATFQGEVEEALAFEPRSGRAFFSRVQSTGHKELWQVPPDGSPPSFTGEGLVQPTKGLALSPRGDRVVWSTCTGQGALLVLEGDRTLVASPLLGQAEWSDDYPAAVPGAPHDLIVVSDRSGAQQLWRIDVTGKDPPRRIPTGDLVPIQVATAPDGKQLAFAARDRGLFLMPIDGSAPARQLTRGAEDLQPAFGGDGKTLYFTRPGAAGRPEIAAVSTETPGEPRVIVTDASSPAPSPTAARLAYSVGSGDGVRELDLDTGLSRPIRVARPMIRPGATYSPDGRRLAVSGLTELVEIDTRTGSALRRYATGDQLIAVVYLGARLVIARIIWRGDLWEASLAPP